MRLELEIDRIGSGKEPEFDKGFMALCAAIRLASESNTPAGSAVNLPGSGAVVLPGQVLPSQSPAPSTPPRVPRVPAPRPILPPQGQQGQSTDDYRSVFARTVLDVFAGLRGRK